MLWKNFDKIIEGIELKISRCLEVDESGKLRGFPGGGGHAVSAKSIFASAITVLSYAIDPLYS